MTRRKWSRLELLLTVPSYTLTLGSFDIRRKNRIRLWYILRRLVSRHNWAEASGVLSVLLKGTAHERSPLVKERYLWNSRMKFSVAMELRRHMARNHMERHPEASSQKIDDLYRSWILNVRSYKNAPFKDKYLLLDHVLSSLARNKQLLADGQSAAHDALNSLKLMCDSGKEPMSYLIVGLASYEVWYRGLLKMIHERDLDDLCIPLQSETDGDSSARVLDNLREDDAGSINETYSNLQYQSEVSVAHDNGALAVFNQSFSRQMTRVITNPNLDNHQQFRPQIFDQKSAGTVEATDDCSGDRPVQCHYLSSINLHGMQKLLPFKVPFPQDLLNSNSRNQEYYLNAVKYLKLAFQAPPPVSTAALLPLLQLLLVGDQIKEAFDAVGNLCKESDSVLPYRLKACLQECVDVRNYDVLSSDFEDVMKKDPTCLRSLARLVDLHQRGEYSNERLVEMLALHLEATHGNHVTWKEFASCLLRLSHCEEDRVSTCFPSEQDRSERRIIHFSRVPAMFKQGSLGKTWKLRCKWWLNRHFSRRSMRSEMEKGDWSLMAWKAASASHLYGKEMEYVVKVYACLEEHDNSLLSFLRTHMENSVGFFSYLVKR